MSPHLKSLIFNIVSYSDEVDEKGKPIARTAFKKDHLRGVMEVKKAILSDIKMEVADKKGKTEWVLLSDFNKGMPDKTATGNETCSDSPMKLSDKAIAAVKFYYEDREELPATTAEALDELDKLLK